MLTSTTSFFMGALFTRKGAAASAHTAAKMAVDRKALLYLTARLITKTTILRMSPDQLSLTFSALADPTRRAILARLASGDSTVKELARPFTISLPAVTKHLKVLARAGLIARSRAAQWRPCRLKAQPLHEVSDWVEHYRRHWEESFDRLDDYLKELQMKKKNPAKEK
jgi:DNA-binding transcriptional ArsR family regulator